MVPSSLYVTRIRETAHRCPEYCAATAQKFHCVRCRQTACIPYTDQAADHRPSRPLRCRTDQKMLRSAPDCMRTGPPPMTIGHSSATLIRHPAECRISPAPAGYSCNTSHTGCVMPRKSKSLIGSWDSSAKSGICFSLNHLCQGPSTGSKHAHTRRHHDWLNMS